MIKKNEAKEIIVGNENFCHLNVENLKRLNLLLLKYSVKS